MKKYDTIGCATCGIGIYRERARLQDKVLKCRVCFGKRTEVYVSDKINELKRRKV